MPGAASSHRPRLLIISPDFPPAHGGIQVVVHRLATMLTAFEVSVVTRSGPDSESFDVGLDFPVHRSRRSKSRVVDLALLNAAALGAALRSPPAIVLAAHIATGPSASVIRRVARVPACIYLYADEVVRRPALASFAIRTADRSIAISEHTRRLALARGADPHRLHLILPGVDVPSRIHIERRKRPTVLTVARLEDRFKGHDTIIKALVHVRERVPDVEWVVIGDGSLRAELEGSVADHGLQDHVRFLGATSDEVRDRWLGTAHVFAMPSRVPPTSGGEGFGIVFIEAGVHGLPVVAGNVGGALDAVVDGQTGLLVNPNDPQELADAISSLLLDPGRAERIGEEGRRRGETLAWPRVTEAVQEVLLALLRDRKHRGWRSRIGAGKSPP